MREEKEGTMSVNTSISIQGSLPSSTASSEALSVAASETSSSATSGVTSGATSDTTSERLQQFIQNASIKASNSVRAELPWYNNLGSDERQFVDLIIQTALEDFVLWLIEDPDTPGHENISADHLFAIAPLEITSAISLTNVLDAVRVLTNVFTQSVSELGDKFSDRDLTNAAMYYSRECAFSAARVYAGVAESRSVWGARDEALIIESLIDHEISSSLQSRMSTFQWGPSEQFVAVVGTLSKKEELRTGFTQASVRKSIREIGGSACMSLHNNEAFVALIGVGTIDNLDTIIDACSPLFAKTNTICIGPVCAGYEGASYTVRAALNGFHAAISVPGHPNPLMADDVLAERALFGDTDARQALYDSIFMALKKSEHKTAILTTLETYLLTGNSLEKTAQILSVHPNTVRYRLKKSVELTGWDANDPRESYVLLTALKIGLHEDAKTQAQQIPVAEGMLRTAQQ